MVAAINENERSKTKAAEAYKKAAVAIERSPKEFRESAGPLEAHDVAANRAAVGDSTLKLQPAVFARYYQLIADYHKVGDTTMKDAPNGYQVSFDGRYFDLKYNLKIIRVALDPPRSVCKII